LNPLLISHQFIDKQPQSFKFNTKFSLIIDSEVGRHKIMEYKISIALFISLFLCGLAEKARFDNYRVYEVSINNEDQLNLLLEIENYSDSVRHIMHAENYLLILIIIYIS
jgi:hypothetical protein